MPALTIGRMAKLYGLHRSTLHEAVARGRISAGFDGKGQRVIDLSEMIRVYGEPLGCPTPPDTSPTPSPDTAPTPTVGELSGLLEELRLLRQEVRELREAMLLLEHKPATPPAVEVKKAESFADLLRDLDGN